MNRKTWFGPIFVMVMCLLTSGCISIEQEIFLEPDGSGDLVIHISMPDLPEEMKKNAPPSPQDPQKLIDELKLKIANELPPTITLKDAKEVRRNGAIAYYMVVHFNRLDDVNSMLGKFSQETLSKKDQAQTPESLWNVQMQKAGDLTVITQRFYTDMVEAMGTDKPSSEKEVEVAGVGKEVRVTPEPAPKPAAKRGARRTTPGAQTTPGAKPAAPKEENYFQSMGTPLMDEETMNMLASSLFKLRFVLHAPKKIAETNADIVLNGNTAVWNATFGAFAKDKKPIEMKVTY
jgi:hypothetical protein